MSGSTPKQKLLELLSKEHEVAPIRGFDIVAINSKAILYVRYNKNAGQTGKYLGKFWFGITKTEYDKYYKSNLFIICVCKVSSSVIDYIVLPAEDFESIKKDIPLRSGQWKFNLLKTLDNKYQLQITNGGIYDVSDYLGFFDFSPKGFRKDFIPSFIEISSVRNEKKAEPQIFESCDLENELLVSARDSSNPKRFELALERFFSKLGFKCKRIGGSGETDVLIYEPVCFIVDGKSTKSASKSAINFTRIKGHMTKNNAEFMMIASVGFDPAVCKDAELEGATLLNIDSVINILRLHNDIILSPYDLIKLFKVPGLVSEDRLNIIRNRLKTEKALISNVGTLIDNMDFSYKNIDQIMGRLDLFCEQNNLPLIDKEEISQYLYLLKHDLLAIVSHRNDKYALNYTPILARERYKIVADHLISGVSK